MIPISSRQKWGVYFDLERQVLNEVREFLRETNNRHFLEHDGWSCENEINETDFTVLHAHGFNDEDIWDIASITAFFGMSNRIANFSGMLPNAEFYAMGRIPKEKK
jgi:hypothetical protein